MAPGVGSPTLRCSRPAAARARGNGVRGRVRFNGNPESTLRGGLVRKSARSLKQQETIHVLLRNFLQSALLLAFAAGFGPRQSPAAEASAAVLAGGLKN